MNYEGWSNGATKLGWVVQIEQLTAVARWVSGLGMRQLMAAWVLDSKMGFSCMGMGSSVMAWAAASSWRDGSLTFSVSVLPLPFFSFFFLFFFPSFLAFLFGFGVLLTTGFSSSSFFFLHIYILRFSWALKTPGLPGWDRDG